jgi:hypothetical protein
MSPALGGSAVGAIWRSLEDIAPQTMKERLGAPQNRPLADFLPTVTITAKNLATEITNFNVAKEDLQGERCDHR